MSVATASFATTASYWSGSIINAATASFVANAQSASYWSGSITNALSSSFASTASYWSGSIFNAVSASFSELARSASYAETASFALQFVLQNSLLLFYLTFIFFLERKTLRI